MKLTFNFENYLRLGKDYKDSMLGPKWKFSIPTIFFEKRGRFLYDTYHYKKYVLGICLIFCELQIGFEIKEK
jgi:hypothetical protein